MVAEAYISWSPGLTYRYFWPVVKGRVYYRVTLVAEAYMCFFRVFFFVCLFCFVLFSPVVRGRGLYIVVAEAYISWSPGLTCRYFWPVERGRCYFNVTLVAEAYISYFGPVVPRSVSSFLLFLPVRHSVRQNTRPNKTKTLTLIFLSIPFALWFGHCRSRFVVS